MTWLARLPRIVPAVLMATGLAAPGLAAPGLAAPGLAAPGLAAPGLAAPVEPSRWFARPPVEEVEPTVARRSPAPPEAAPWLIATAAAAYGMATDIVSYGQRGIGEVANVASAAMWEASYALGVNRTPAPALDPAPILGGTPPPPAEPPPDAPAPEARVPQTPVPEVLVPEVLAPEVLAPQAVAPVILATRPTIAAPPAPPPIAPQAPVARGEAPGGLLANFVYDSAARRPEGGFFVPKPLQRLFAVRTRAATTADLPVTVTLPGRIVPDPQAHGHVEASLTGRIAGPPAGLPVLGETVVRGQVLAFVSPAVGMVDRTQMRRDVARLTSEIRVETETLERLRQFMFVAFRDGKIRQSELRLEGLRRERAALLPMLDTQEVLRAPVDGVVSIVRAVEGGIVRPGEAIFDVVNPARLWIEAMAPDPAIAADAGAAAAALARTPEGQTLRLRFVGSGLALREQATPILFRIDDPPPGLRLDRPVTVSLQAGRTLHGIPLPREAVSTGADGVTLVWEQTGPESFAPHPVRARDLDGERVLVVDGLADGARVVCGEGVRLMAQLQ